jgi:outer membrane protein OmpA-like peptidoglycan-associated protein
MMMRRFGTIVLVLLLGVAISGCVASKKKGGSSVEVEDATIGSTTDSTASGIGTGDTTAGEIIVVEEGSQGDLDDPLGQRVVYFDFDSANLTPEARRVGRAR